MKLYCFRFILTAIFILSTNLIVAGIVNDNQLLLNIKLILAVDAQNQKEVEKAINNGADVNFSNGELRPLHLALTHSTNTPIVKYLLDAGANPFLKIRLSGIEFDAFELINWYILICFLNLKKTEFLKLLYKNDSKELNLIKNIEQECKEKINQYQCILECLNSYKFDQFRISIYL